MRNARWYLELTYQSFYNEAIIEPPRYIMKKSTLSSVTNLLYYKACRTDILFFFGSKIFFCILQWIPGQRSKSNHYYQNRTEGWERIKPRKWQLLLKEHRTTVPLSRALERIIIISGWEMLLQSLLWEKFSDILFRHENWLARILKSRRSNLGRDGKKMEEL